MTEEWETVASTLKYKIPFFVIGVLVGMGVVWLAFQWVPGAIKAARVIIGG